MILWLLDMGDRVVLALAHMVAVIYRFFHREKSR
jgi:hypothetical protein